MKQRDILKQFIDFLGNSPSQFHATQAIAEILRHHGFTQLHEKDSWDPEKEGKYFVLRGGSSIAAFRIGKRELCDGGFRIIGAHTDSPALKVKPVPENHFKNYLSLGVEVYGGPILPTWFDRDLSIAGRVSYAGKDGKLHTELVDFENPVAIVPSLAIHLHKGVNESWKINRQKELPPILLQTESKKKEKKFDFRELLQEQLKTPDSCEEVLDYDLYFYDTQKAALVGMNQEFLAAGKLDNLLSCYTGLQALIDADSEQTSVLICNDHEEVGSASTTGAAGTFLQVVLERLAGTVEDFRRAASQSRLLSADNAHGIHPNYQDKHDGNHGPLLNKGPVIKINGNQRYATNSESSSAFQMICKKAEVPVQKFVVRSDMGCGSTIGPITATNLGIETLDIGAPTFGMHSIREVCGSADILHVYRAMREFFSTDLF